MAGPSGDRGLPRVVRRVALVGAVVSALLIPAGADAAGRCGAHPWCDTSLSPDRRGELLVGALTPEERIGLLAGDVNTILGQAGHPHRARLRRPRVGLPPLFLTDGPVGVRQGQSTALPASMALAASFDLRLARAHARVVANEAKLKGNDLVYAPTVNILRTPLWGRAFESFGEDPFLTSRLGVAWIRAAQREGVIANVKHYAVNNQEGAHWIRTALRGQPLYGRRARGRADAARDLPAALRGCGQAGAASGAVMCAYNRLNGPHACESGQLLDRILRARLGLPRLRARRLRRVEDRPHRARRGARFRALAVRRLRRRRELHAGPRPRRAGGGPDDPGGRRPRTCAGCCGRCSPTGSSTALPTGTTTRAIESRRPRAGRSHRSRRRARCCCKTAACLPLDAAQATLAGGDRRRRATRYRQRRRLLRHRSLLAHHSAAGDRHPRWRRASTSRYDSGSDPSRAGGRARGADAAVVVVADTATEGADKPCLAPRLRRQPDRARARRADRARSPPPTPARSSCSRRPGRC